MDDPCVLKNSKKEKVRKKGDAISTIFLKTPFRRLSQINAENNKYSKTVKTLSRI